MGSSPQRQRSSCCATLSDVGIRVGIQREDSIMTSIMRRTVRGTAAGLGALAIIAGAAACGGGETETTEPPASEEKPAEDEGEPAGAADPAEEDGGEASTDEGEGDASTDEESADEEGADEGDAAAGEGDDAAAGVPLSEEDLTAAGDRFFEFLQAAAGADGETACSLITNPLTDQPLEGKDRDACVTSFTETAGQAGVDPATADMMERSMIEAVDNGDGTAGITLMGTDAGLSVLKADDGQWYVDGAAAMQQQAG